MRRRALLVAFEGLSAGFGGGQGGNRALADHLALALGEGRVQVQHERLDVRPELGDDERDAVRHQAGNEMDVPAEAIELGNRDRAFPVRRPSASAAASCGRRSIASAPLPVSISTNSPTTS